MRKTLIVAALVVVATPALWAQATPATRPETVFVKGNVYGEPPCPMKCHITGSKSVFIVTPAPVVMQDTTVTSASIVQSDTTTKPKMTAKKMGKKVSHGAKEAGGDVSKAAKKAGHGIKEAASDVKKKVTGKP
jgi:hypothetical protein